MIIIQKKEYPYQKVRMDTIQTIPTDWVETEEMIEFQMDLPGIPKDAITIALQDNVLTVEAALEKKEEAVYLLEERTAKKYQRSFELEDVDPDGLDARLEQGVLTIQIHKKVQPINQKKYIQIQ
ncbi:MAG: Hsp20/alpha crystallin family protein [Bacilli bacterium]|jgi:HSP20 family protein|nr:Hsp20/alpha crystallin family protein [Bacilli bacterium]